MRKSIKVVDNAPIEKLLKPIQRFLNVEASGGIVLLIMTVIALIWANSSFSDSYFHLWQTEIKVAFGDYTLDKSLHWWINDGLMMIFFFVVGLEIKRELLIGELSSVKNALLPVFAAIGGMIFPALIYLIMNHEPASSRGWGVPMATDIAFSLGILSLLGKRVPFSIKVFLTAFAIIDDLGAVIVIAIFYTAELSFMSMLISGFIFLLLLLMNALHVRKPLVYVILGIAFWIAFISTGIHPTIAGVLLALTIPTKARINSKEFIEKNIKSLNALEESGFTGTNVPVSTNFNTVVYDIENRCESVAAPSHRLEHKLHPYVAFVIMPLFAIANAGVKINGEILTSLLQPISLGVILGLFFGKSIGITFVSWLMIKLKFAVKPTNSRWSHLIGTAFLGGIGFTMSLFVASLAFKNPEFLDYAKLGILSGSLISALTGLLILRKK